MAEMTKMEMERGRTMHCPCACGKEWHRPVANYCYNCGAKLEKEVDRLLRQEGG